MKLPKVIKYFYKKINRSKLIIFIKRCVNGRLVASAGNSKVCEDW